MVTDTVKFIIPKFELVKHFVLMANFGDTQIVMKTVFNNFNRKIKATDS